MQKGKQDVKCWGDSLHDYIVDLFSHLVIVLLPQVEEYVCKTVVLAHLKDGKDQ
jgi:hypothetical protein